MENNEEKLNENEVITQEQTFVDKIWDGEFGLATAFWVYAVLGSIAWSIFLATLGKQALLDEYGDGYSGLGLFIFLMISIYFVVVFHGIWKASDNYLGDKKWSILAKFWVIANLIPIATYLLKLSIN